MTIHYQTPQPVRVPANVVYVNRWKEAA